MLLSFVLIGCGPDRVKTDTIEMKVPVLYCPAPPVIPRPVLPIHTMTEEELNSGGEVVKHWKASTISLLEYSKQLEIGLGKYFDINMSYEDLKLKMESIEQPPTE